MTRSAAELEAAFQFHKGTIRTSIRVEFQRAERNFNSIKVRLERWRLLLAGGSSSDFNSIKVRLERNFSFSRRIRDTNFNSIKVRLEHYMYYGKV